MLGIGKWFQQLPCLTPRSLCQSCGTAEKNVPTKSSRTGRIILLALLAEALSPAEDVMLPEPERVAAVG
jgi:hypothetical protein